MTDPTAHYTEPDPPPTLASTLGGMAEKMADVQGQMMFGAQWPTVKAEQARQRQQAERAAQRRAQARLVLFALLLVFLATLGPAVVVLAWRVAL